MPFSIGGTRCYALIVHFVGGAFKFGQVGIVDHGEERRRRSRLVAAGKLPVYAASQLPV